MTNESTLTYRWNAFSRAFVENMTSGDMTEAEVETLYNRLRQPMGFFENIGDESIEIGHQLKDLLVSCTFGGTWCGAVNFTYFQSPTYYNCYTFNGGNVSDDKLIARSSGPKEGLSLILYLESDNGDNLYNGSYHTLSNVGNAAGVRVVIHRTNSRPSPIDHGQDIPPGFSSSLGMTVGMTERLGEPYGFCREDLTSDSDTYIYSSHTCLTLCQQNYVMETCACVSSLLPIPENNESNLQYCGTFDPENASHFFGNIRCEADALEEFSMNETLKQSCECYSPCEERYYTSRISYSYWPLEFYQTSFFEHCVINHPVSPDTKSYQNLAKFNVSHLIDTGLIRKNFVRLNVYLEELTVQESVQKETYVFSNLFSDIGGTFGLWIGVSVITWCEIIEMVLRVLTRWCRKMQTTNEMRVDSYSASTVSEYSSDTYKSNDGKTQQ